MIAFVSTVVACRSIAALSFHCNRPPSHAASAGTGVGVSNRVDLYNSVTGTWSTAQLSTATYHLAATSVGNVALFASGPVDLYDSATGTWSTARLSVARSRLAATSVGNMALFAGGEIVWHGSSSRCVSFRECSLLRLSCLFLRAAVLQPFFPPRPSAFSRCLCRRHFKSCGLVQQCNGNVVDSSAQRGAF